MNPAKALGDVLIQLGICNAVDSLNNTTWPVYYAKEPSAVNSPDACVTLYNTGGKNGLARFLVDYPSVQVRVRGAQNGYLQSRQKIQDIKDVLYGIDAYDTLDGTGDRVVSVLLGTDIIDLALDEKNRPIHVVNFQMIVEPAPSSLSNRVPIS